MRHYYRFIILCTLLISGSAHASMELLLDVLDWRAMETNDWAYVNSETLPTQTITYKTIDFGYTPGFRLGVGYAATWDALFSFTRLYITANDSAVGNIQPAFSGSVTSKPSTDYLYASGQVRQSIDYDIFDLNVGQKFHPASLLMLHPFIGLMGGWINQTIDANYFGSTSASEHIANNFNGIGPKVGVDLTLDLTNCQVYQPMLFTAFSASYMLGHWNVMDRATSNTAPPVVVTGTSYSMGTVTLQGAAGFKLAYKNLTVKLAYEINDWFNQTRYFDNDTGTHNNDLILQGLTLGVSYDF